MLSDITFIVEIKLPDNLQKLRELLCFETLVLDLSIFPSCEIERCLLSYVLIFLCDVVRLFTVPSPAGLPVNLLSQVDGMEAAAAKGQSVSYFYPGPT